MTGMGYKHKGQLEAKAFVICEFMHQHSLNLDSVHYNTSLMVDPLVFKGSDKDTMQQIHKAADFYLNPTPSCKLYKIGRYLAVLDSARGCCCCM